MSPGERKSVQERQQLLEKCHWNFRVNYVYVYLLILGCDILLTFCHFACRRPCYRPEFCYASSTVITVPEVLCYWVVSVPVSLPMCASLWTQCFISCLEKFYQLYNFGALGHKHEPIRFWGRVLTNFVTFFPELLPDVKNDGNS